jgi:hypothetical protein
MSDFFELRDRAGPNFYIAMRHDRLRHRPLGSVMAMDGFGDECLTDGLS